MNLMRKVLVAALILTAVAASPAIAAPPAKESTIAIHQPPPYVDGDAITFDITLTKIPGNGEPQLHVQCFKADDPSWELHHAYFDITTTVYLNMNGAADCMAWVELWGHKGGFKFIRVMTDRLVFHVDAAL